nr:unnamed protein product [Callosobruchus analis]
MVEQTLVWAHRRDPYTNAHSTALWPALTFTALVSSVELAHHLQPVEFLVDRELAFKEYKQLKPYLVSLLPNYEINVNNSRPENEGNRG